MATATLVLYKAARTTAHLNENLRLLAANEGQRTTTSYASRWLAKEAQERPPEPGEIALVALALYPYDQFLPCRLVTICEVAVESAYRQFTLDVGPFVAVDAQDKLGRLLAKTPADQHPRQAFLSRVDGIDVTVATDPEGDDEAWRGLTSTLAGHGEYGDALFARAATALPGMTLDEPVVVTLHMAGVRSEPTIRMETSEGDAVLSTWTFADDIATVELVPRSAGRLCTRFRLVAHGQLSAPVTVEGSVEGPRVEPIPASAASPPLEVQPLETAPLQPAVVSATEESETVPLRTADVRRLLWELERRQADDPGRQLAELAAEAAPGDTEISAAAASFLARAERYDEAAAMLARFDPADLPVPTLYLRFLSACKAGRLDDAEALMERLDFATDEQFGVLRGALESVPDATAIALGYKLLTQVLDVHRGLELFSDLRERLRQPADVERFAEHLWTNVSEQEGIDLLIEHTSGVGADTELLKRLLEYVAATEGNQDIGPQIVAEAALRIERGELHKLDELVELSTRDARFSDRLDVIRLVSEALGASAQHRVNAVSLLCRESDAARASGRVREAAELAERAAAIAAGDAEARMVAADTVELTRAALEDTEPLRTLLARDREARIEGLRAKVGGTTLRIVGGKSEDGIRSELRKMLGFKKVEWTESEKHQKTKIDWVNTVDPVQTIVVVLTDAIGHATSIPLKTKCHTRHIRHVEATRGLDAIIDGLLREDPP